MVGRLTRRIGGQRGRLLLWLLAASILALASIVVLFRTLDQKIDEQSRTEAESSVWVGAQLSVETARLEKVLLELVYHRDEVRLDQARMRLDLTMSRADSLLRGVQGRYIAAAGLSTRAIADLLESLAAVDQILNGPSALRDADFDRLNALVERFESQLPDLQAFAAGVAYAASMRKQISREYLTGVMSGLAVAQVVLLVLIVVVGMMLFRESRANAALVQQQRLLTDALGAARGRLDAASSALNDGVVILDAYNGVALMNPRFAEMFPGVADWAGVRRDLSDMIDHLISHIQQVHGGAESVVRQRLVDYFTKPTGRGLLEQLRDGRHLLFRAFLTTEGGRVLLVTDMTDMVHQTEQLELAKSLAEEANRTKSDFLAVVSHELRTPLNGILGMAELLATSRLDDRQGNWLNMVRRSASELLALVDDILDLSSIEAGKLTIVAEEFDLRDLVERVTALLSPRAEERGNRIYVAIDRSVPQRLRLDGRRLRQILINLVGNAIKFTERGRIDINMRARVLPGGAVELLGEVRDTGIGIAPSSVPFLFEKFHQLDNSSTRQHSGTGLGLAISQAIARQMGGDIGVESALGQGSCFWFTVRNDAERPGRSLSVALIDSNPIDRALVTHLLEAEGHQVTEFSGLDQMSAVDGRPGVDLVLVNLEMPGHDGTDPVGRLRDMAGLDDGCPLIGLTADLSGEAARRALAAGAATIVAKPIDVDRMFAAIARSVDSRAPAA